MLRILNMLKGNCFNFFKYVEVLDFRDDFGVVESMTEMLDMVKVMQFAVTEGKVAIHCHAGKGEVILSFDKYILLIVK